MVKLYVQVTCEFQDNLGSSVLPIFKAEDDLTKG